MRLNGLIKKKQHYIKIGIKISRNCSTCKKLHIFVSNYKPIH